MICIIYSSLPRAQQALEVFLDSAKVYYHQKNWSAFDEVLGELHAKAKQDQDALCLAEVAYLTGSGLLKRGQNVEAFSWFLQASDQYLELEDTIESSANLLNMAIIQTSSYDFSGSQETSIQALKLLEGKHHPRADRIRYALHNNLGIICNEMGLYDASLFWHGENLLALDTTNKKQCFSLYNNLSVSALKTGENKEAFCYLGEAKYFLPTDTTHLLWAYYLDNLSTIQLNQRSFPSSLIYKTYKKALAIRVSHQHTEGIIKSYIHLANYFSKTDQTNAYTYYKEGLKLCSDDEQRLEILEGMMLIQPDTALIKRFTVLNKRLTKKRSQVQNTFALTRYQVEKQKRISANLQGSLSQKSLELSESRYRILSLWGLSALLLLGGLFLYVYQIHKNKINKQKNIIERLTVSEQVKEDISLILHDDLASELLHGLQEGNRLTHHHPEVNFMPVLDAFELCYERLRQFSQGLQSIDLSQQELNYYLRYLMLQRSTTGGYTLKVNGFDAILWSNYFELSTMKVIYRIFQELFTNISKHSQATIVQLTFVKLNNSLEFYLKNDAVITANTKTQQGIGLTNIKKQIHLLSGSFESHLDESSTFNIRITLPYDKKEF